jgi:hypothetical protein
MNFRKESKMNTIDSRRKLNVMPFLNISECVTCTSKLNAIRVSRDWYIRSRREGKIDNKKYARRNFFHYRAEMKAHLLHWHGIEAT